MNKFILVHWDNNLQTSVCCESFDSAHTALMARNNSQDEVIEVESSNVQKAFDAIQQIAAACWTPNQGYQEKEENEIIERNARKTLKSIIVR